MTILKLIAAATLAMLSTPALAAQLPQHFEMTCAPLNGGFPYTVTLDVDRAAFMQRRVTFRPRASGCLGARNRRPSHIRW